MKCKILVSNAIWNNVIEALIPTFPLLLCHANKETVLGKTLISMFDPDVALSMMLPDIEVSYILILF